MSEVTEPILLDATGQEIVGSLNAICYALKDPNPTYGFIEHKSVLSPGQRIEYIGANRGYRPVVVNKNQGTYDLKDWVNFEWLKANKPWMVSSDGKPDYRLDEENYAKKLDGTDSDVANTSYDGGAFSWGALIYKYEHTEGTDRYVEFSFTKRPGFEPTGFLNENSEVLRGRWIPMFYGSVLDGKATCISGTQPSENLTTDQQKAAIDSFSTQAKFFGGPFWETLVDLATMFAKTTNLEEAYGYGNRSGYVNDSAQHYGVKANAVIGGGQFFGTTDGHSLNKIFHSIVLGSYQQWMRDPYELVVNGRVKVSKDYTYDLTGESYTDTGIDVPASEGWKYTPEYVTVVGYGAIPDTSKSGASTETGSCDGTYTSGSQATIVAVSLRSGDTTAGATGGLRARHWHAVAGSADWAFSLAVLLDPPAGVAA